MKYQLFFIFVNFVFCVYGQDELYLLSYGENIGCIHGEHFNGKVERIKQRFYKVSSERIADHMEKLTDSPVDEVDQLYLPDGRIFETKGPGYFNLNYRYNKQGKILEIDQRGDVEVREFRRITLFDYDKQGRLIRSAQYIPDPRTAKPKNAYQIAHSGFRTATDYRYDVTGKITGIVITEKMGDGQISVVHRDEYVYDVAGLPVLKYTYDRNNKIVLKEEYSRGRPHLVEYINSGNVIRQVLYDEEGRIKEDKNIEEGNILRVLWYEYNTDGLPESWSCFDSAGFPEEKYTGIEFPEYAAKVILEYDDSGNTKSWSFVDKKGITFERFFCEPVYDNRNNWIKKAMIENKTGRDYFVIVEREITYYIK